jgi:hypothetical protein
MKEALLLILIMIVGLFGGSLFYVSPKTSFDITEIQNYPPTDCQDGDFVYGATDTSWKCNTPSSEPGEPGEGVELPIGTILMFDGNFTDNSTLECWFICDGTDGTPNLVNQFIRGGSTSGDTGGSDTNSHNHTVTSNVAVGDHSSHTHTVTSNVTVDGHSSHTHTYTQVPNHVHVVPIYSGTTDGAWATFDSSSTTPGTVRNINSNNPTGGVATATTNGPSATLTHTVTNNQVTSNGPIATLTHSVTNNAVTSAAASDTNNIPSYYTLIYIQRRC